MMHFKSIKIILITSLILISTQATRAQVENDITLNDFEQSLADDLNKVKRPYPKDAVMYHYFNTQDFDPNIRNKSDRERLATYQAERFMSTFWDLNIEFNSGQMVAGPGLYAATESLSSSSYGNTVLIISSNSDSNYYLDLSNENISTELSGKTIRLFEEKYGLVSQTITYIFKQRVLKFSIFEELVRYKSFQLKNIRRSFLKVFKKLNITGFHYNWIGNKVINKICVNQSLQSNAFIFFGSPLDGINPGQMNNSLFKFKVLKRNFILEDSEIIKTSYLNDLTLIEKMNDELIQTPLGKMVPNSSQLAKKTINCL